MAHSFGHCDLIGSALLPDAETNGAFPVETRERTLIDKAILDGCNILQAHRLLRGAADHQGPQLIETQGLTHHPYVEFAPAFSGIFKKSCRYFEVLAIESFGNFDHRDAVFDQPRIVKPDPHGAIDGPTQKDVADTGHAQQSIAHITCGIHELTFRDIAAQACPQDREIIRIHFGDDGRINVFGQFTGDLPQFGLHILHGAVDATGDVEFDRDTSRTGACG